MGQVKAVHKATYIRIALWLCKKDNRKSVIGEGSNGMMLENCSSVVVRDKGSLNMCFWEVVAQSFRWRTTEQRVKSSNPRTTMVSLLGP